MGSDIIVVIIPGPKKKLSLLSKTTHYPSIHVKTVAGKQTSKSFQSSTLETDGSINEIYLDAVLCKLQKTRKSVTFQSFPDLSSNRSWATQKTMLPHQLFCIPGSTSFNWSWAKAQSWCLRRWLCCLNFALLNKIQHALTELTAGSQQQDFNWNGGKRRISKTALSDLCPYIALLRSSFCKEDMYASCAYIGRHFFTVSRYMSGSLVVLKFSIYEI